MQRAARRLGRPAAAVGAPEFWAGQDPGRGVAGAVRPWGGGYQGQLISAWLCVS